MPRFATSTDLDGVLRLAARKDYPTWPSQDPRQSGLPFLEGLREPTRWPTDFELLVTEDGQGLTGFLVLKKQWVRSLTGDRESIIQDSFALRASQQKELLEHAARAARRYGTQYLTMGISPDARQQREQLESLGFGLESHRISVPTAVERIPEGSPYSVRPVTPEDAFMIGVLNSTMLGHTLSAGRDYDLGELAFVSMRAVMEQVNRPDPRSAGLALTLADQMVGHLLLHLTDRFGYISDLALEREHWGGIAVRHLMRAGSRLLFERNLPLFVGDVSASNRRALVVAQRALGFTLEWQRYGLRLWTGESSPSTKRTA